MSNLKEALEKPMQLMLWEIEKLREKVNGLHSDIVLEKNRLEYLEAEYSKALVALNTAESVV